MMASIPTVRLRAVSNADLSIFFDHQGDPVARRMAAFTPDDDNDRAAFDARWTRIRNDRAINIRTAMVADRVVGHVVAFDESDHRELSYWIDRKIWGTGVATAALTAFLEIERARPLHARAAFDNHASIRVLEKCGFTVTGRERGYANARGRHIDELIFRLDWSADAPSRCGQPTGMHSR